MYGLIITAGVGAASGALMGLIFERPIGWSAGVGAVAGTAVVMAAGWPDAASGAPQLGDVDPGRYGPNPKQARAIARKSGCHVRRSSRLQDGSWAYRVECPSHAAKVLFLANLAEFDSLTPDVRRTAEWITAGSKTADEQIARLHRYVRDRVTFTREPTETFSPTMHTLTIGAGDCDDSSRALVALLRALGHEAGMGTLPDVERGKVPRHVAAQVRRPDGWRWLETTLKAETYEHPLAAAKRLGVTTRGDLAA